MPLIKGLEQLQAVALQADIHFEARAISWRVLIRVLSRVKVTCRQLISCRGLQLKLLSIGSCEMVNLRVELQRTRNGKCSNDLMAEYQTKKGKFNRRYN